MACKSSGGHVLHVCLLMVLLVSRVCVGQEGKSFAMCTGKQCVAACGENDQDCMCYPGDTTQVCGWLLG